jgi:signal peptidase I
MLRQSQNTRDSMDSNKGATKPKPVKPTKTVLLEYAEAVAVALILAFFIRAYVIQAFVVPSGSMKDTLLVGDYVIVNKFIYRFKSPSRGDVIVFKYPLQDNDVTFRKWMEETFELVVYRKRVVRRDYVKRVVGIPGDVVMGDGGAVYVNGEILDGKYLMSPVGEFGPFKVPDNNYFVIGDNVSESRDSRDWGYVPRRLIKGKALIIYWSRSPDECPQHRADISVVNSSNAVEFQTGSGVDGSEKIYICEGGGELLRDYEDVRKAPWYAFWARIRWSRIAMIIK